jgi:hypothetical protein
MAFAEASNHFWLRETARSERSKSAVLKLHEDFHEEVMHKMVNAFSK